MLHAALAIRTTSESHQVLPAVQTTLRKVHPKLIDGNIYTIRDVLKKDLAFQHTATRILSTLGGLALLLAAVGTYGVMAYVVNSRTREIGIRMAIGATRRNVMQQVIASGLRLGLLATVIGGPIALGAAILLRHQIEGISPFDPISFGVVILLVLGAMIAACCIPAHQASKIDPMEALRYE